MSLYCDVTVYRDGKIHHIRFEKGGNLVTPLEVLGNTTKHGTLVRFLPDPEIFSTTEFKWDTIYNHLQESAFLLKKVKFILKDERTNNEAEFYYENGLKEYIEVLNRENKSIVGDILHFEDEVDQIQMEVALQFSNDDEERIFSYVNNVRTRDGGTHETGFKLGLTKAVNEYADRNNMLRGKGKLEGSDIREGLTAIISLRLPESILQFEGQTKGKLGTQQAVTAVSNLVYTSLSYYLAENIEFATALIKKCLESQKARNEARKARENAKAKRKNKDTLILSDKLTPAQSKDYSKNELFIVEGDSAGGSAKKGRNPKYQAILPLRGKPLNTFGLTKSKFLQNEEISTIINTIGAGFDDGVNKLNIEDAHYGKIIIMTDADTDGAHIQTLLLTFFYCHMQELIEAGMVYIAVPPLYRVYKENGKGYNAEYAWDDEGLNAAKAKIGKGYKVSRYKGLGEMDPCQLRETTMDPAHRLLIQVGINRGVVNTTKQKVSDLMGNDPNKRKIWISENINFNKVDKFEKEGE